LARRAALRRPDDGALGAAACRFGALVTLAGLLGLAGIGEYAPAAAGELAGLAARVLWPVPVLLAMEVAMARGAKAPAKAQPATAPSAPAASVAPPTTAALPSPPSMPHART
jgi:hypothetical protein